MSKLTTLKDIERDERSLDYLYPPYVRVADLRQEAIKWIKVHQDSDDSKYKKKKCNVCAWIKHFFNISEEDLK